MHTMGCSYAYEYLLLWTVLWPGCTMYKGSWMNCLLANGLLFFSIVHAWQMGNVSHTLASETGQRAAGRHKAKPSCDGRRPHTNICVSGAALLLCMRLAAMHTRKRSGLKKSSQCQWRVSYCAQPKSPSLKRKFRWLTIQCWVCVNGLRLCVQHFNSLWQHM